MNEIEEKALALVNEVLAERRLTLYDEEDVKDNTYVIATLCRAIEQHEADKAAHAATIEGILKAHEAFKQEVSDAVESYFRVVPRPRDILARFIIPKPDPLADAWIEATGNTVGMEPLNEALAKRGLKIVEIER